MQWCCGKRGRSAKVSVAAPSLHLQTEGEEVDSRLDGASAFGRLEVDWEVVDGGEGYDAVDEVHEETGEAGSVRENVEGDGGVLDEALLDPEEGSHANDPKDQGDEDFVGGPRVADTSPGETKDGSG